jgi:hypothetical protein
VRGFRPRGAGRGVPLDAILTENASSQERRHQPQDAPVSDPSAHPAHKSPVVDLIEAGADVRVHHPLIGAAGEEVDLSYCVLGSSPGPKAIRARRKVRLEDRLEHELERSLHHPIPDGRDAKAAALATGLGDHPLPHRDWAKRAGPKVRPQVGEERCLAPSGFDRVGRLAVDTSRSGALIAPYPAPCNKQERRVSD